MILLVLVALVARVDAAPGDAPVSPPVRDAKLLTGVEAPNGRPADSPAEADETDDAGDADDAAEADETDDADDADDAPGDRPEVAGEADPGPPDTGNPDLGDLDPSDLRVGERLADGIDGDRGALADDEGVAGDDASQLALREAELAPAGVPPDDDANAAASPAGALETYEAWIRQPRLSLLGRLDVSLAWRRLWSVPMHTMPHRADEIWLVATWRR